MAMAMAMAVIPAAAVTAAAAATSTSRSTATTMPRKGLPNLSCSRRLLLRMGGGGGGLGGMRAALLGRHCPRSSGYGGGEVIEAEFTPVVEEKDQAPPPVDTPQQGGEEIPAQEQGYYGQSQYEQGGYGDQGQAQYAMEGGGEDQAQYEMEGGSYDQEYDEEQQFYEGYDQSGQYQQYDQSQYDPSQQQQQSPYAAAAVEEKPKEPPPYFDNIGKVMKFIALGRAMQFKLDSQKDFERFLDKCSAYGVMIPEAPSDIKRNLCELDPKETWIVVDSRAVMKFAKKLALEEAERNKNDYPPGFVENMLNRDKYGRYKSDDDY